MPRRTFCEHPTRHNGSRDPPKVQRSVSSRLADFIRDQYDLDDVTVNGLCAKCHAFEVKQMNKDEVMEVEGDSRSNDEMSNSDEQEQDEEEIEEPDSDDHHEEHVDISDKDEQSSDESLYEITYQQQEAVDKLSNVFRILNMDPIHDQ